MAATPYRSIAQRDRETERHRDIETERQRDRERETERQRDREMADKYLPANILIDNGRDSSNTPSLM